jgi:putative FmdB family regulatory protein
LPIYEYRCRKGHTFEVKQSMNDDPVATCTECRSPVERVFHPVAVHFKGSGFYATDYGRKRSGSGGESAGSDGDSTGTGNGKGDSKESSSATKTNGSSTGSDAGSKASDSSAGD